MNRNERIRLFVQEIWTWYERHKRTLPWRDLPDQDPTHRAYKILVSEIMLQQTQVPRVVIKYKEFLERFSTMQDLSEASNRDVLIVWRGMGYNSRALRLRDASRKIIENAELRMENIFPISLEDLTRIPGIGHYTAAAIRNFAFGIPTPCIDTNIRRILHRTFIGPENLDGSWSKDDQYLLKIAEEVLLEAIQTSTTAEWHAALMDFGSLVQIKRNPKWEICPLTREGIMKATKKNYESRIMNQEGGKIIAKKSEPGRHVGSTFIPNRIFRGRVIEALRDAPRGLSLHDIGRQVALDWDPKEHQEWLRTILQQLTREAMLGVRRGKYVLG